jgi:orotate phosphoribosyltransferase
MNSHETLREQILAKAVVHGRVILSSGKEADYYVDLRRVTLDSQAAPLVGQVMLDLTKDLDYEAVGGLTLGADPVATAMMHVAAAQGKKIGWKLAQAIIDKARTLGAKKLYLESNTILEPAINLYRKLGFTEVVGRQSAYERANIKMELIL